MFNSLNKSFHLITFLFFHQNDHTFFVFQKWMKQDLFQLFVRLTVKKQLWFSVSLFSQWIQGRPLSDPCCEMGEYWDDLADPASQTWFGGCHLVKHVGKHGLLNMPTLHLHPSSPWWSVCYHESTCCFTGFEFVCSLLVNFMSRLYQKCSPKASALHSKLCRQIFCLADEWYWGEKWGSWDKCN